jgi:UDP-glucose-4-epimerase GalE
MERKTALITGGSGYLGVHLAKELNQRGWRVITLDLKNPVEYFNVGYIGDVRDKNILTKIFKSDKIDTVFHLAGRIEVGESFKEPTVFYDHNLAGTCNLLNMMVVHGIKNIVYSSSAAVYKQQDENIKEDSEIAHNSPYGYTKYASECAIRDSGLNYVNFRYFNLAGADPDGEFGENHDPETHLIPRILQNLNSFQIYGNDYNTPDGTCIRDYVHVSDVAAAHVDGALHLLAGGENSTLNLGTGLGYSVLEIIGKIEQITEQKITYNHLPRRPGDPSRLVADITLAKKVLNFEPKHDIISILKTAYEWQTKHDEKI